jgi:type III pantothenate kinase
MSPTFLSVDLGNTRCKLCLWAISADRSAELIAAHEIDGAPGLGQRASTWLAAEPRADSAAVSSVAARELEDELCAGLESQVGGAVRRRPDPGLAIEYRAPETVGSDRLFAARGAFETVRRSAIVVDAGTALTVDVLRVEGARAAFSGGAIAPGPKLLAEALARGTARLKLIEPRPGVEALGRDTEAALQSGVVVGFRGAARELVERISAETKLERAPIVLTGGASIFLSNPPAFGARLVHVVPDLVHRGLIAAALAPVRSP